MRRSRATCLTLAVALAMTGCAHTAGSQHRAGEVVVGSRPGAESVLLADIYTGALRSYGSPARTEQAADPLTKLDSGAFVVVPGFTGRVLQRFQPDTTVRSDAQVYKTMVGALPEGIAAGDYTTAAEDKPALAVTESTAKSWGGTDLSVRQVARLLLMALRVPLAAARLGVPPLHRRRAGAVNLPTITPRDLRRQLPQRQPLAQPAGPAGSGRSDPAPSRRRRRRRSPGPRPVSSCR